MQVVRDRSGGTADFILEAADKKHVAAVLKPLLAQDFNRHQYKVHRCRMIRVGSNKLLLLHCFLSRDSPLETRTRGETWHRGSGNLEFFSRLRIASCAGSTL